MTVQWDPESNVRCPHPYARAVTTAGDAAVAGDARGRTGLRRALPPPRTGALPVQPLDSEKPGRRQRRRAEFDGKGVLGATEGTTRLRADAVAVQDRSQRIDH